LYAGHGEFPRIIFAPGSIEEAFTLTQKAFEYADRFQVPVFILSDQYLVDSYYPVAPFPVPSAPVTQHTVTTDARYHRYTFTPDGISPRGTPGAGTGTVCVDSDEHDESGRITESMQMRVQMTDKRLHKLSALLTAAVEPTMIGPADYETIVIGWGSTYHAIAEALQELNNPSTAFMHLSWLYPLHPKTAAQLSKAKRRIIIEQNATGQCARLLLRETGITVEHKILKYDGLAFTVEDIVEQLRPLLK